MKRGQIFAFVAGAAGLVALTVYAGAGAVLRALGALNFKGLLLVALVHLPIAALIGLAWWLIGRDIPGAGARKFIWARFVRDAAAEALPFSQLGGFVLGLRALHLGGVSVLRGALAMSVDLVVELWAKVPYFLLGLIALFALRPGSHLFQTLFLALGVTVAVVSVPIVFRNRLGEALETSALAIAKRWPSIGPREELRPFYLRILSRKRSLFAAFALHFACWTLGAGELWIMLALMGVHPSLGEALAIDSLVSGLRTFGFLVPAAAGVQEASFVLVGALFGLSPATAVAVSLVRRARDLALGAPILAAWQYQETHAGLRATTSGS